MKIATCNHFLHEEASHNRLACPRIVCKQEAQWLTRQHRFINRSDLVWEWLNNRGVDSQDGVEKMSKPDALRLRDKAKQLAIAIRPPGPTNLNNFDPWLVVTVQELVRYLSFRCLVR